MLLFGGYAVYLAIAALISLWSPLTHYSPCKTHLKSLFY